MTGKSEMSNRMKIALCCPASLPATQFGGILFLAVDLAKELSIMGHDVTIYTTDLDFANNPHTFNKKLARKEILENFTIKRSHAWFSLGLFFVNPTMYFQMLKDESDIIHSIGVRSFQSFIAALISKKKKIPLVVSDQGGLTTHPDLLKSNFIKKTLYTLQAPMIKFILNQALKIIVANEYEKEIFAKLCNTSKIIIVRNGINLEISQSKTINFKEKYGIQQQFILFIGRFHQIKGIDILLNAINLIKGKPEMVNIKLVIMGADFGYEQEMFKIINELKLNTNVLVIKKPPREEVISAYKECKFLVLPSRWELSPLTPLEGFTFKKTVISTKVHGIPFTITNEVNGLLVDLEDIHALSDAIIQLVNDDKKCEKLGNAGYDLVKNTCNSNSMATNTLKVYQQIINK